MTPRSSGYALPVQWMVTKGDIGSDFAEETDTNDTATKPPHGISRWKWEKWKKPEVIITPDKAGSSRNVPWTGTHDAPGLGLRIEVDIRNYPEATRAGRRPNGKETRRKSRKPRSWPTAALRNDQNAPGDESGGPRSSSRPRVLVRLFSSLVTKVGPQEPGATKLFRDECLSRPWEVWIHRPGDVRAGQRYCGSPMGQRRQKSGSIVAQSCNRVLIPTASGKDLEDRRRQVFKLSGAR